MIFVVVQTSALWKFTRYLILTALPFKLVNDVSQFVGPTFLNLLLGVVSSGQPSSVGYTYAIIMLTLLIIGTAADNQHFQRVMRGGRRCNMAVHICVPACMQNREIWAIWAGANWHWLAVTEKLCTEKVCRPNMAGISAQEVITCTKSTGVWNYWTCPRVLVHQQLQLEVYFTSHWLASVHCFQSRSMFLSPSVKAKCSFGNTRLATCTFCSHTQSTGASANQSTCCSHAMKFG